MPKIEGASVREHRERRHDQIVAAAEGLLAEQGVEALTAGAVARRAGIARNSLYRYFGSMDDLVELVVTSEFPRWQAAVRSAVSAETDPRERAVAYVKSNIDQAARGSHGARSSLSRIALSTGARSRIKVLHDELTQILTDIVGDLEPERPGLVVAVLQSLVDACILRIDTGDDAADVLDYADAACRRLLA